MYRGETDRFLELINKYLNEASKALESVNESRAELLATIQTISNKLKTYADATKDAKRTPSKTKALKESDFFENIDDYKVSKPKEKKINWKHPLDKTPVENKAQHDTASSLKSKVEDLSIISDTINQDANSLLELWKIADKSAKLKTDKLWSENELTKANKLLVETLEGHLKSIEELNYWQSNIEWLQSRFPEDKYEDVVGLCKIGDREDYVEEQDYSLNSGRYVGVEIEDNKMTKVEFFQKVKSKKHLYQDLLIKSKGLEEDVLHNLTILTDVV